VVLNFANSTAPGGYYRHGARAQEEDLFRRSNYACTLDSPEGRELYPIPAHAGIYSPAVQFFRATEAEKYVFLEKPETVACIAAAAPRDPKLDGTRTKFHVDVIPDIMMRMQTVLQIAEATGHDAIVLGAWGCGAFHNPPEHVAQLFADVLHPYMQQFRGVVAFAILDHHNRGLFRIFSEHLGVPRTLLSDLPALCHTQRGSIDRNPSVIPNKQF